MKLTRTLNPIIVGYIYLCFVYKIVGGEKKKENVLLLRLVPTSYIQLEYLKSLRYSKRGFVLQIWRQPDELHRHVDLYIANKSLNAFKNDCAKVDLGFEIVSRDVYDEMGSNVSMKNIERFDDYYQEYDEIVGELKRLSTYLSNMSSLEVIGHSYENREVHVIKIHGNHSDSAKKILFVNCGTHSREWLAIAACKYVARKLLFGARYDEDIQEMLKQFDVFILPLVNPDGYVFSHENKRYRLWRKSRSMTTETYCRGVDLNRNFNYRWGGGGSSPDPCEEIYCGVKPFSEKESLLLARYLYKIRRRLVAYLDVHTYGQMWMSPWGYSNAYPKDYRRQERAMKRIQDAIQKQENGARYRIGRSSQTLYQTSGDSLDWVYGRLGIAYTFGLEMRPKLHVRRGFRYTRHAIGPTGNDLLTGLKALSRVIVEERNEI